MNNTEMKKILNKLNTICNQCEVTSEEGLCRDIPINKKILIGCGLWGKLPTQDFYDELHKRSKMYEVINNLIKGGDKDD